MFETFLVMVSVGLISTPSFYNAAADALIPPGPDQPAQEVQAVDPVPMLITETPESGFAEPTGAVVAQAVPVPEAPGLVAEPQTATGKFTTALEVKPILNATRGNWITVREHDGQDLVYVTHLWAWRCGLLEMRVGINGNPPEPWPMPDCHLEQPAPCAILETDGVPYRGYALGSVALIEVQLTYDDLTTAVAKYNREGRLVE